MAAGCKSSGFRRSLQLASAGAAQPYVEEATRILRNGEAEWAEVSSLPYYNEAMARQGLELLELKETPGGLGIQRRAALLATVLQERIMLAELAPGDHPNTSPSSARFYRQMLEKQISNVIEHTKEKERKRSLVEQRQAENAQEQDALKEEKATRNEEQAKRVQVRNDEARATRKANARKREASHNDVLQRAEALQAENIEYRQERMQDKEERRQQCLESREKEVETQRHQLLKRFELVKDASERAREIAQSKMATAAMRYEEKAERSEQAQEACRQTWEMRHQEKRDRAAEKEHQALRVARMHEYMRQQRWIEIETDMANFEEATQFKKSTDIMLATGQVPTEIVAADLQKNGLGGPPQ